MKKYLFENILIISSIFFINIGEGCYTVQPDTNCHGDYLTIDIPKSSQVGYVTISVNYSLCSDFNGGSIEVYAQKGDYSSPHQTQNLSSPAGSGTFIFSYNFTEAGNYSVQAIAHKPGSNARDKSSLEYLIEITTGSSNKIDNMITEANKYITYSITWYNRNGNVLKDLDNPTQENEQTKVWTSGIPYSLYEANNSFADITNAMTQWKQHSQSKWYQYSPGKIGLNYYDNDAIYNQDPSYPYSMDVNYWVGVACQSFLFNCAKVAGYSFISDDNYRYNSYNWATVGSSVSNWQDAQRGDIAFIQNYDGQNHNYHVALIITPNSTDENSNVVINSLGVYSPPYNYKVCQATIGEIKSQFSPTPTVTYRRLPSQ